MIRELKTFEYRCDFCGETKVSQSFRQEHPSGWGLIEVGPCGLTDYYRNDLACEKCLAERA